MSTLLGSGWPRPGGGSRGKQPLTVCWGLRPVMTFSHRQHAWYGWDCVAEWEHMSHLLSHSRARPTLHGWVHHRQSEEQAGGRRLTLASVVEAQVLPEWIGGGVLAIIALGTCGAPWISLRMSGCGGDLMGGVYHVHIYIYTWIYIYIHIEYTLYM